MVETFSLVGEASHQDAMRLAAGRESAAVACLTARGDEEPKVFLVVTPLLIATLEESLREK